MSENVTTSIRLSKAAKEFNIALATAVEFLVKKGYPLSDANPNTKLSEDEYLVLQKEFQKDKSVLEKAHTLEIGMEKKPVPITLEAVEKKETKSVVELEEDITIKTNTIEDTAITKKRSSKKAAETEEETEEKPEKKAEKATKKKSDATTATIAEAAESEEPAAPESIKETPEKEKKSTAKSKSKESPVSTESPVEEVSAETTTQAEEKGLKVLGHIDIKGSSGKSSREELKKAAKEFEKAKKAAAKEKEAEKVQNQKTQEAKKAEKVEQEQEIAKPEEKETVRVHAPTLSGPKIIGEKVDLSKFTESSPHGNRSDKKKRKRVKRQADASSILSVVQGGCRNVNRNCFFL